MTPAEAAKIIGIYPSAVRGAIRNKTLKARKVKSHKNQFGYVYDISPDEVKKYKKSNPNHIGWPRGVKRVKSLKKVSK